MRWKGKWKKQDIATHPTNAIDASEACHADLFPNVRKLLAILTTVPVSTATNECSYSTVRRLKTYLRSTMGEQRLTGLGLLSIHREQSTDKDSVLNKYTSSSNRRSDVIP